MAPLLQNLLELYSHDLSAVFSLDPGPDGRFGYDRLPLYWAEPERRHAFLIMNGPRLAGFVLVTRGSPIADDPTVFDVAEFFVLRAHRRSGVGRHAALALWRQLPGRWMVRVATANAGALTFWREVVQSYTAGAYQETTRPGHPHAWQVFTFASPPTSA